ncbi:hypothetical protein HML84_17935 [Alcanivorax sp. IO_7]|nr:hypothetical protein HML84_17935 [Alcanivorax sp. IO_7]
MSVLLRVPFYWAVAGSVVMIGALAASLYQEDAPATIWPWCCCCCRCPAPA